jgi:hypothetical protein
MRVRSRALNVEARNLQQGGSVDGATAPPRGA